MRQIILTLFILAGCTSAPKILTTPKSARLTADLKTHDVTIAAMVSEFKKIPENPQDKNWVKAKLQHMYDVDQYMRNYMMNIPFQHKYTDDEKKEFQIAFINRFSEIDTADTKDLKQLLKIYHWFTISEFGKAADNQAWILVQHADLDRDFQEQVLSILAQLVPKKETNPSNYAYLYDRVVSSFNDPTKRSLQRYGTQGSCIGPGTWEALPTEDPKNLDRRRSEVGLGSQADYVKKFKEICH